MPNLADRIFWQSRWFMIGTCYAVFSLACAQAPMVEESSGQSGAAFAVGGNVNCPSIYRSNAAPIVGPEAFEGDPGVGNSDFLNAVETVQWGTYLALDNMRAWLNDQVESGICPAGCEMHYDAFSQMHVSLHGVDPNDSCYSQSSGHLSLDYTGFSCTVATALLGLNMPGDIEAFADGICQENGPSCHPSTYSADTEVQTNTFESSSGCTVSISTDVTITCGRGDPTQGGEVSGTAEAIFTCDGITLDPTTTDITPDPSDQSPEVKSNKPSTPMGCDLIRSGPNAGQCGGECPVSESGVQMSCLPIGIASGCECFEPW